MEIPVIKKSFKATHKATWMQRKEKAERERRNALEPRTVELTEAALAAAGVKGRAAYAKAHYPARLEAYRKASAELAATARPHVDAAEARLSALRAGVAQTMQQLKEQLHALAQADVEAYASEHAVALGAGGKKLEQFAALETEYVGLWNELADKYL